MARLRGGVLDDQSSDDITTESKAVHFIVENLMQEIASGSSQTAITSSTSLTSGLISFAFKLDAATEWMGRVTTAYSKHCELSDMGTVGKQEKNSKSRHRTDYLVQMCDDMQFWKTTSNILHLRALGCKRSVQIDGQLFVATVLPKRVGEAVLKSIISVFCRTARATPINGSQGQLIEALTEAIASLMSEPSNTTTTQLIGEASGTIQYRPALATYLYAAYVQRGANVLSDTSPVLTNDKEVQFALHAMRFVERMLQIHLLIQRQQTNPRFACDIGRGEAGGPGGSGCLP